MKRAVLMSLPFAMVAALATLDVPAAVADDDKVIRQTEEVIREPAAPSVPAMPSAPSAAVGIAPSPGAMTYSGVVTEVNPTSQVIIMKPSQPAAAPVTYTITPQTVFLDSTGKTVSYETIRNAPVTVEYYTEGGRTVVRRVIATGPAQVR